MTLIGITLVALTVLAILRRFFFSPRPYPFPAIGYAGASVLLAAEVLLFLDVNLVAVYFTPLAWTGYIFWADSAVFSLRGRSLWKTARIEFLCLALGSIPLWLIFEAYNLRLANWVYVGLPEERLARGIGYAWSFATIWPAIFETATLLRALGRSKTVLGAAPSRARGKPPGAQNLTSARRQTWVAPLSVLVGAILLTVPVLLPPWIGSYLFGAVWLGFIFLLEPINYQTGRESLWRDLEAGGPSRVTSLLAAGWVCGILWEFWNYWAQARWVYVFPIFQEWRIFAMPLPGYLGFPAFTVECFALFAFLAPWISGMASKFGAQCGPRWNALEL